MHEFYLWQVRSTLNFVAIVHWYLSSFLEPFFGIKEKLSPLESGGVPKQPDSGLRNFDL